MNKKRILTVAGCVMLICLTVWLNAAMNKKGAAEEAILPDAAKEQSAEETAAQEDYFAVFRQERDSVREKEMEYLDNIVTAEETDPATLEEAQTRRLALIDSMEREVTVEGLIRARGFSEAAVTVHEGSVNVVIDREALTDAEAAQILDIVRRETGESAKNIKIMPIG